MAVLWSYYNAEKFRRVNDEYLPLRGEGGTMATQVVTAINKLIYRWYNDGDVYDNTGFMQGWANNLSSYANWLDENIVGAGNILYGIYDCRTDSEYEDLLRELADFYLDLEVLDELNKHPKTGSIYDCDGCYVFEEPEEDEDEYYW